MISQRDCQSMWNYQLAVTLVEREWSPTSEFRSSVAIFDHQEDTLSAWFSVKVGSWTSSASIAAWARRVCRCTLVCVSALECRTRSNAPQQPMIAPTRSVQEIKRWCTQTSEPRPNQHSSRQAVARLPPANWRKATENLVQLRTAEVQRMSSRRRYGRWRRRSSAPWLQSEAKLRALSRSTLVVNSVDVTAFKSRRVTDLRVLNGPVQRLLVKTQNWCTEAIKRKHRGLSYRNSCCWEGFTYGCIRAITCRTTAAHRTGMWLRSFWTWMAYSNSKMTSPESAGTEATPSDEKCDRNSCKSSVKPNNGIRKSSLDCAASLLGGLVSLLGLCQNGAWN